MSPTFEYTIAFFILVGSIFMFIGSFGLLKLPSLMTRIHAPTKATTLGVGGVLVASMLFSYAKVNQISIHEVLIILFLFGTAPISAHFIARAHLHEHPLDPDNKLPATECECQWAVLDDQKSTT